MKKVTLGLLILFVAMVMTGGPKPTAVPKVDSINLNSSRSNIYRVRATLTATPTPNGSKTISYGKGKMPPATGKEVAPGTGYQDGEDMTKSKGAPVEPTAGPIGTTTTMNGSKSNSFKEVAPTITPGDARAIKFGRDSLKGSTKEVAPTTTPTDAERLRQQQLSLRAKEEGGKNDGEKNVTPSVSDKTTTVNGVKSNSYKEGAPTTPTPGPVGSINLNSGRSNIYREGAPVTVTPSPAAVPSCCVKGSRSNGSERNSGHAVEQKSKPTPTKVPARLKG